MKGFDYIRANDVKGRSRWWEIINLYDREQKWFGDHFRLIMLIRKLYLNCITTRIQNSYWKTVDIQARNANMLEGFWDKLLNIRSKHQSLLCPILTRSWFSWNLSFFFLCNQCFFVLFFKAHNISILYASSCFFFVFFFST